MEIRRLAVSEMTGDNRSGRFHGILHELARHIPEIVHFPAGIKMAGWRAKLINRLYRNGSSEEIWHKKQRSIFSYRARSAYAEEQILAHEPVPDLCLQMLQHFCPFMISRTLPYVIYMDYTMAQAAERYPLWTRGRSKLQLAAHIRDEGIALRHARHLFTFTENTRRFVIERFGIAEDSVTTVGVGCPHKESAPRKHLNPHHLLYVGHEFERKGGRYLYEAFSLLREKYPELTLNVVGEDADDPPEGVNRLGKVTDPAEMNRLYAEAGLFVLPSICDPSPLVIAEAMHHGLPVVSTAVDGIPEMVLEGKTGSLVPPCDSRALADAIETMLHKPESELLTMGQAGRAHALKTFNWERAGERMWNVLKAL